MTICDKCGLEYTAPTCPHCASVIQDDDDVRAPAITEREVVENMRVGRDVTPAYDVRNRVPESARELPYADFPIPDSKENATLSWQDNSPAHEALRDVDERELPLYRKTWFWVLVTIVVIVVCCWACWELIVKLLLEGVGANSAAPTPVSMPLRLV